MTNRRAFLSLALGAASTVLERRTGAAQAAGSQQQGQAGNEGGLRDRGAPTGRTGAATRGAEGELTLDLVAPLRGIGLTAAKQPELCYIMSARTVQPMRLAISTPGRARPLASLELQRSRASGLGVISLRDLGIRLTPDLLCAWSLTVAADPRAPSQDLVANALIQYRPGGLALEAAREASLDRRIDALARAGYWYDAVTLAEQSQDSDHGAALARLLGQAELRMVADIGTDVAR